MRILVLINYVYMFVIFQPDTSTEVATKDRLSRRYTQRLNNKVNAEVFRTIYNGGVSVELTSRYWWRVHLHTTFLPIILFLYCMVPEWVIWVSDVISGIKYRQDIFYPYMITHEFIRLAMKHILDPDLLHILQSGKFHFATCWNLYGKLEVPKGTSEPVKRKSRDTIKSKRKIWQKDKQRSTKHYTENYW